MCSAHVTYDKIRKSLLQWRSCRDPRASWTNRHARTDQRVAEVYPWYFKTFSARADGIEIRLPLNSKRLTGRATKRIATELGLPTTASTAEVLQMIDANLSEGAREPSNVQVLVKGDTSGSPMALIDETGRDSRRNFCEDPGNDRGP